MIHYNFPIIHSVDDILPAIKNRPEFIVVDKDDYIVCNYAVSEENTFKLDENDYHNGLIRRECRGIKFYPNGEIMARPFHKFFNVNEKDETQADIIDLSRKHVISEKIDGSMVHPVVMKSGNIRWATKMGITDVSMQAEVFIAEHPNYMEFARVCISQGLTPIFEWISPDNQIVIHYNIQNLILLAVRDNITGQYLDISNV